MQRKSTYRYKATHKRFKKHQSRSKQCKHISLGNRKFGEARKKKRQQQNREQEHENPQGWRVRWRPNILRGDYNRSPFSTCSQTAGEHRHESPATCSCTCRPTCGKCQMRVSATRMTLPTHAHSDFSIHCAPCRKTNEFSQKNTIHDPHTTVCL